MPRARRLADKGSRDLLDRYKRPRSAALSRERLIRPTTRATMRARAGGDHRIVLIVGTATPSRNRRRARRAHRADDESQFGACSRSSARRKDRRDRAVLILVPPAWSPCVNFRPHCCWNQNGRSAAAGRHRRQSAGCGRAGARHAWSSRHGRNCGYSRAGCRRARRGRRACPPRSCRGPGRARARGPG